VVLQRSKEVKTASAIRQRITKRLDSWEATKFDMLVQDTERTALAQLARVWGTEKQEQRARCFLGLSSKASLGRRFGRLLIKKRRECYSWSKQMKRPETSSLTY
jgi:hypothetical protein